MILESSIIQAEKQKLAVQRPEISVNRHSDGNYFEFLENAGQLFCQFSDLTKLKRPPGAHPSLRAQNLANSAK